MKTNMMGIIFAELYGSEELNALTYDRNMAAIPFGGRYRLIDFTLSNMVNSGIDNIGVLVKQHYRSLMDHLASGQEWDLNRKNGGLHILPPYANESITHSTVGKMDELRGALDLMEDSCEEYVLMAEASVLYSMDYAPLLDGHISSGADITAAVFTADGTSADPYRYVFRGEGNTVTSFALDTTPKCGDKIGIGVYIISRSKLIEIVREYTSYGAYHFERDFIQRQLNAGRLSVHLHPVDGPILFNRSIKEYLENSLLLTDESIGSAIFRSGRPIYTRVNDEVPTYYGTNCHTSTCIIADGCVINGSTEHSVLSRGVRIGSGANIKNCVIMDGTVVEDNVLLENVIIDKRAVISEGTQLKGLPTAPVIIRKGAVV